MASLLESSVESSLNTVNVNRWLLKMLPFSENLSANSSYFNKVKENLSNPIFESASANRNIWLSNAELNSTSNLFNNNLSQNSSVIDTFDTSRL
jgi:hypothetical protein